MTQYSNIDRPSAPQVVTIKWEPVHMPDDSGDTPDPKAGGYVGADNVARFDELHAEAEARMRAWELQEWQFIGVKARATISVPIGGGSFTVYTLESAGLWGVESDAGDYLAEVFEEEKASLLDALRMIGAHVAEASQ